MTGSDMASAHTCQHPGWKATGIGEGSRHTIQQHSATH